MVGGHSRTGSSLLATLCSFFLCSKADDCSLRFRETTLTRGGWGVIAAREYREGDVIAIEDTSYVKLDESLVDSAAQGLARRFNDTWMYLPDAALANLIQSHDFFLNVKLTWSEITPSAFRLSLTASRTIGLGQELFLGNDKGRLPYEAADRFVTRLWKKLASRGGDVTHVQWVDVLRRFKELAEIRNKTFVDLLPKNLDELQLAATEGGVAALQVKRNSASEVGHCLDTQTRNHAAVTVSVDGKTAQVPNHAANTPHKIWNQNRSVAVPLWPLLSNELHHLSSEFTRHCIYDADTLLSFCPLVHGVALQERQLTVQWIGDRRVLAWSVDDVLSLRHSTGSFPLILEVRFLSRADGTAKHCKGVSGCHGSSMFPAHWKRNYQHSNSLKLGQKAPESRAWNEERSLEFEALTRANKCGIYMAPSRLKDAGFGLYARCTPNEGSVMSVSPSIFIPYEESLASERLLLKDYIWDAAQYGASHETLQGGKSMYAPGFGALCNSHLSFSNVVKLTSFEPLLDRRIDPGAGAFTDYESSYVYSGDHMGATCRSEELIIQYGESWFSERRQFRGQPRKMDYEEADAVLSPMVALASSSGTAFRQSSMQGMLELVTSDFTSNSRVSSLLRSITSVEDLLNVLVSNGTAKASVGSAPDDDWLERNGHCFDHLYTKESPIPQAGRGAFARRKFRKDSVLLSSPMIPIFERRLIETADRGARSLLANYVFGHPSSTVVFLPLTLLVAVNHASDTANPRAPNAKIQLASWDRKSNYFTRRPLEDLEQMRSSTIIFDLVATRDVDEDEEILLSYGKEWDEAWTNHVRTWKTPCPAHQSPCFKSSKVIWNMNFNKFNTSYHSWTADHFTACHLTEQDDTVLIAVWTDGNTDEVYTPSRFVRATDDGFNLAKASSSGGYPCEIVGFDEAQDRFDVLLFSVKVENETEARVLHRHRSIPSNRVVFKSKPFMSDMHWSGAFRHYIRLPNDVFPDVWKDSKTAAQSIPV